MEQYHKLLKTVLENGIKRDDRTNTGTISMFGLQTKYDLDTFPLVTTKEIYWKGVVGELLWFLSGSTNIKFLIDNNIHIWDYWADENLNLGPIYGKQWRNFNGVDQITQVISEIKNNPMSRRLIVSAWNVNEIDQMALPPCHTMFQFYVTSDKKLDCMLYQRSADLFLGVPFNIASYSLLTYMIAQVCDLKPGVFTHTLGDAHIYINHIEQVKQQLKRPILNPPTLKLNTNIKNIFDFNFEDIELCNYNYHPKIKAKVSI